MKVHIDPINYFLFEFLLIFLKLKSYRYFLTRVGHCLACTVQTRKLQVGVWTMLINVILASYRRLAVEWSKCFDFCTESSDQQQKC